MRRLSLVLTAAVLAGCGGAAKPEATRPPAEAVEQAAAKMAAAGSARFTIKGTFRNKDYSRRRLPFRVKGLTRFDGKQAWIWWNLSKIFPAIAASTVPAHARESLRLFLEGPRDWQMELRVRGKRTWMRLPGLTEAIRTKPWIQETHEAGESGEFGPETAAYPWVNPAGLLPYLRALRRVETVGREGDLMHYRGRVALGRLSVFVPKGERAATRKEVRAVLAQTGQSTTPLDLWIDDGGLPRRLRLTGLEARDGSEKHPTKWRATVELVEYGVQFDVLRPPARIVVTEKQLDRRTKT